MKHDLAQSSYILTNLLDNPCLYGSPSIDMLSFTIPFSENATKSLYRLQQIRTADRQYKLKQLTNDEVGSHKYRKCITATFSNGAYFSIYLFGLNERQNRVRVQFNPNTVGLANAIAVFNDIRQMVGKSDYDMCISNSKVTRVDYTLDIPNLAFEHLIVDYAYRTTFESFIDDVSCLYSGFQYGAGNGCPVKFYDKAFEQGGMFNGYSQYTRLEKLHKPNARGRKSMFRLSELHTQKYAFQGVTFYDPLILDGMPKSVFELIRREGIGKAVYLLTNNNRRILERKMCKYKLQASTDFKKQLIKRYQEKLYELQNLIATPHRFADRKIECA